MADNLQISSRIQLERKLDVYLRSVERYRLIVEEIKDVNSKYSMGM